MGKRNRSGLFTSEILQKGLETWGFNWLDLQKCTEAIFIKHLTLQREHCCTNMSWCFEHKQSRNQILSPCCIPSQGDCCSFISSPTLITKGASPKLSCKDCIGSTAQTHCTSCLTYTNEFQGSCIPDEHHTLWWIVRTRIQIAMKTKKKRSKEMLKLLNETLMWEAVLSSPSPMQRPQFILIISNLNYYSSLIAVLSTCNWSCILQT